MLKKCLVRSLGDCAMSELANSILSAIGFAMHHNNEFDDDGAITIVAIISYLDECGATSAIYQELLKLILSSDYLDANIRFTCLQMLLNSSVQTLVSEIFPFAYYEQILQVIAAQGSGLRALNLKGVWVKEEHMRYMYDIIKNCTHLTRLYIPYIATDELLEYIAKYSRQLRVLDISGETDITEIGIDHLCNSVARDLLTVVDIGTLGEENICHTDIAMLISSLPNLENLSSYSFVGQSLVYIRENIDVNFRSKLRYLHDTKTSTDTMEVIIQMCPILESVYLDTPQSGVVLQMQVIRLRRIKLYKFCCKELGHLLELIGGNVQHLTVIKGRGTMNLGKLAQDCGRLMDLDCYMMEALTYVNDRKFDNLLELEILNSPFSNNALRHFICNAPTLQRLAVDTITLNDEDIARYFIYFNWF